MTNVFAYGQGPDRRVPCPSYNGTTALFNVFPLGQASRRLGLCEADTPRQPATLPLAEVPPLP